MKKNAFKLGINEIIDLFKPTHADQPAPSSQPETRAAESINSRPAAGFMRSGKQAPGVKRQESEIYGRRW